MCFVGLNFTVPLYGTAEHLLTGGQAQALNLWCPILEYGVLFGQQHSMLCQLELAAASQGGQFRCVEH